MDQGPIGFMSYVRFDDPYENERLIEFCARLSSEVRAQLGRPFPIFHDRNSLEWSQHWYERIQKSSDTNVFLFPILTPEFFKNPFCHDEVQRFRTLEEYWMRGDLILPLYYINTPLVNDVDRREADPLAKFLATHQYVDWRELRFELFTSPLVRESLAQLAGRVVAALNPDQPQATKKSKPAREPRYKTEPPTRVVDLFYRGDYQTLTAALKAARPGDRILVRPGLYREALLIDKPVEILGDGEPGEVVIEARGRSTVTFRASMGRLANLTLRQAGREKWFCVDIIQGRLDLEDCDLTGQTAACVAIHDGADPRLRRNRIHHSKASGVYIFAEGQGTLEDNEIFGNDWAGVAIQTGANPTLRRNRIHTGRGSGVCVYENGRGVLEDNEIFANLAQGVVIKTGGNPILRRNRIHHSKLSGVLVYQNGQGKLEDNHIFANTRAGVAVREGGCPTLRRNRIYENAYSGIWVYSGGGGVFEDNDLRCNRLGPWQIDPDCRGRVKLSNNQI